MKKFLVLIMSVMAVVSVSAAKKTVSGSESSPDFAFPQTVAADASEKMGKAMKAIPLCRCVELCATQLVVADNLVDRNNAQASIAMLDSIGALMLSGLFCDIRFAASPGLFRLFYDQPFRFLRKDFAYVAIS